MSKIYLTEKQDFEAHVNDGTNPHDVTKSQVGLGNVDNTSDTDKPVSTAQQTAIDTSLATAKSYTDGKIESEQTARQSGDSSTLSSAKSYTNEKITTEQTARQTGDTNTLSSAKGYTDEKISAEQTARQSGDSSTLSSAKSYTDEKVADLINGAPSTLDTLKEIADAMAENEDVVSALETSVGTKANATDLTSHTSNKSNPHGVTKSQVGLGNVENKSSATIRGELTKDNVTTALGYTPPTTNTTYSTATTSSNGLMSSTDKSKLDGIASGANNYSHPTTSGNKHIPSGGSSGQILRWSADGTAVWGADNNTTYSTATTSTAGLMSASDKSKLDGIASGANAYSLPTASSSTLGGVKVGTNLSISNGVLSATDTTYSNFVKSGSSAKAGLVPAPSTTAGTTKYLREDGSWVVPPDTNTTYSVATTSANGLMSSSDKTSLNALVSAVTTSNNTVNIGRQASTTVGTRSVTLGSGLVASGNYSQAMGSANIASGKYSHVVGSNNTAEGEYSFAEGYKTTASGNYSHSSGANTTASGDYSYTQGSRTTALANQFVIGHINNSSTATAGSNEGTTGTAFVIGNGMGLGANAVRIDYDGQIYSSKSSITSGADYAEYFEWSDGNLDKEDRVGYFVTFDEDNPEQIKIANEGDYILGIVSGLPAIIGNGDECWKNRYILDDFGRLIDETFEYTETEIDKETGEEITVTKTGTTWRENPEYDPDLKYISREERPEWSAVGMVGVLSVYDDGTCKVNGYCKCANNGIATSTDKNEYGTYRVIKRVSDNIIKVVVK